MKQNNDKYFSKHPTKELSMAANFSSVEEHYNGRASSSVSVPFMWESQPGTPKAKFSQTPTLPPLTPPPSYFYTPTKRPLRTHNSKSLFLHTIFPKLRCSSKSKASSSNSTSTPSSPASSSSSSSSSSASSTTYNSVPSSPVTPAKFLARGRSMSSTPRNGHAHQYEDCSSRVSTTSAGCLFTLDQAIGCLGH